MPPRLNDGQSQWQDLPYAAWKDTVETLRLWTQIVGKIRLVQTPWVNHSWGVALYPTVRGLTTSPIPFGQRTFELEFDFLKHELWVTTADGGVREVGLYPRPVAAFYADVIRSLSELGIDLRIDEMPNEIVTPICFARDDTHAAYDAEYAQRFWRILLQADRVFQLFRSGFLGKCSPVHFFWGGFDLAVTRFSGRRAPLHPGGIPHLRDAVTQEAYSHEVSSAGFWPGDERFPHAAFYSYAYPEPPGFASAAVSPAAAYYNKDLGEYILPYEAVRDADDPDGALLAFLTSSYDAAATLGKWDRNALECDIGRPGVPRAVR
jgi:Family of unknown function (DUF5996)